MIMLVSSFDDRSFAWNAFAHGINKYWKDCPFDIYFLTNNLESPIGKTIKIPENNSWAYMMKKGLEKIEDKTILFMLEDYWITRRVLTKDIIDFYNLVDKNFVDYIKLMPSVDAQKVFLDLRIGKFNTDALYKTSLNMSIWNKELLYSLIEENENIWEFETQAGKRASNDKFFCAVLENKYMRIVSQEDGWDNQAIEQGKITEAGKQYLIKEGLCI